jgi:AcrR family transcriptional regulator
MGAPRRTRGSEKTARAEGRTRRVEVTAAANAPGNATRERIITTAERLFAEQGVSVSNRQIGEAAGQANNSVVGYHFGTKADLVLAVVRRHAPDIEQRRAAMLEGLARPRDLGGWLECVVKPITDHLDSLGTPSWYARFLAQTATDPALRRVVFDETIASPSMHATIEGVIRLLPVLPPKIHEERGDMTRHIIVHTCAERERALQASTPTPHETWDDAAFGMVDALLGLWRAPVRSKRPRKARPGSPNDGGSQ